MQINQTKCNSDKIKTDAILRGVRVIDYNQVIAETADDLEQLRKMHKKHAIKDVKSITEMSDKLERQEKLVIEWIAQAGFEHLHRDYAVTILVEEITSKE
jgi:hypothetical protein